MKTTHKNAIEIANAGGAIASSDWTTGTGNFVSKRAIPELCHEVEVKNIDLLKGESKKAAKRLLKNRPRVRKIIVVSDWRKLNKLKKVKKG